MNNCKRSEEVDVVRERLEAVVAGVRLCALSSLLSLSFYLQASDHRLCRLARGKEAEFLCMLILDLVYKVELLIGAHVIRPLSLSLSALLSLNPIDPIHRSINLV